jgi:DNA-binding transcriptional ArsR family regulator
MSENQRQNGGPTDSSAPDPKDQPPRPFLDSILEALANWQRREICLYFQETGIETAQVDELGALLEARVPEVWADQETLSQEELTASLEDRHLPMLEDAGVVDYDHRSGTVRYRRQPTVEKWIEHIAAVDDRVC